ncbi:sensor histidine kinase [Olleya sp. HaHaR_3_96]|uniref:sensor histidine kinase n=1 Tax=Olleya sp. HaHaR_3_96 TaxID=2745560 RepID=UPI001C4E7F11|nr:histidine kinase [Olleya sp. HaHaR_3_96]QXP59691.1 histidine kinase [Olleya sp. HaHaR_3_96]
MNLEFLNKRNSKIFELIFISSFWLLLFTAPLFFQWFNRDSIKWNIIINVWFDYLPLLIIFCINRGVLIPFLLFKSRLSFYVLSVVLLITLTVLGSITIRKQLNPQQTPPLHGQTLLQFPDSNKDLKQRKTGNQEAPLSTTPPYINLILLSILLVGFDTGMTLSVKWAQGLQQKAEIQKENIKNELAFLRNQISPHFLMNTLNNIHSLIDFDTKEAKSAIAKLSVLMRHLLYESDATPTTLVKEVNFIKSYIELMKLRFCEEVTILFNLPETLPDITIPSLLFTNILENAFKYGISYENKSFVHINLLLHKNELEFSILNSVHKHKRSEQQPGIGLKNTEKRLKLIYNTNYTFTHAEDGNVFSATIKIPI